MSDSSDEIVIDLMAGWASGAISVVCSQPVDTVLTRVQASKVDMMRPRSSSTYHVAKLLIGNNGIASLWRGSSAMIGAIPFQNAIMMAGYGYGKRWSEHHNPNNVLLGVFIGGCTGGIAQSFLMSPVELIKVNQQVVGRSLSSATNMLVSGVASREMNIAWRGLGATLLRDGLPHGVWFASYDCTKGYLEKLRKMDGDKNILLKSNSSIPLLSGAFAAFAAWAVGYPFDIIKTRIQAVEERLTVSQATRDILLESRGRPIATLYRGFWLKIAKAVPASAINFFVYESVASNLRNASL